MKKIPLHKKLITVVTAVSLFASVPLTALGAAPAVGIDEAVYINLDHYGQVEEVNIVKTCSMNGNSSFTDYGNYKEVINLTNGAAPSSDGNKVTWDLSGYDCDTFYFEGRSKELEGELPWNIDVSYLLNGKPAKAQALAGASGVISTIIKATPNKNADEYFRNNMVLALGMTIDMSGDNYSLSAPGSQLQSIGTRKVAMFMALPGEEGDYRIDVGSDSYESLGVFMAMIPATMSSLDRISDFREVKDKVRDSLDSMSDSADVIFDSLAKTRSSLEETKEGLIKAREAKGVYDAGKDPLKSDVDGAIDSLDAMEQSLQSLADRTAAQREDYLKTMDELDTIRQSIYSMDKYIKDTEDVARDLEGSLDDLKKALNSAGDETEALSKIKEALGGAAQQGANISDGEIALGGIVGELGLMMAALAEEAAPAISDTADLVHELANLSSKASEVINETNALGGRMTGEYKEHLTDFINQAEALLRNSKISVSATSKALKSMRSLMDAVEGSLSGAIDSSIDGLIGILDGSMGIADGSEVFRNSKDVMKNAVDDELDELEEDTNILNIDTSLAFPSFTSPKNPGPQSIQIILRTDEITLDDEEELMDAEPADTKVTVSERVMNVVRKILPFI